MVSFKIRIVIAAALVLLITAVCIIMNLSDKNPYINTYDNLDDISGDSSNIYKLELKNQEILFSAEDYFYTDTVMLELTAAKSDIVEIYYTMNGTSPESNGILFNDAIKLAGTSSDKQKSYVIKACGKREDGSFTDIYTHSYFISEKIDKRFNVIVFSLSTDPKNLYDYDYGIFTEGRLRAEYIKETGDINPDPPAPANYNMRGRESERPVYVEVLDRYGNLLISQNAGMRTFGGWSRAMEQHSIKLYARSEYDSLLNDFNYNFFPDNKSYDGVSINKYKRLVLRNSANDSPFAFLRDEAILSCAEQTYLQDVQKTRPAAVFLNGVYYGFVWLHEVYDNNYLDDKNGIKNGEWCILEGTERTKDEDVNDPLNAEAINDYEEVYSYYKMDLTDDKIFNEFCERVDIENFLTYYAIEIYVANGDWPIGNYKVYRYFGDESVPSKTTTTDGKWRWLLYDTDFGLGLYDTMPSIESLGIILGQYGDDPDMASPLLSAVLVRQDMKEMFVRIMCDLMNYQFSSNNIRTVAYKKMNSRLMELNYDFKHGGFQLKNTWSNMNVVSNEVQKMIDFGIKRPSEMKKQIEYYLGVKDSGYTIYAKKCETADIMVNSCLIGEQSENFYGFYYDINTVKITAQPIVGHRFSHWIVNGRIDYNPELILTKADAEKQEINVELVTVKADDQPVPVITMIDYEGDMDYIQIYNPFDSGISLKNYYISDDDSNHYKKILADYILKPGETINLYCKNYKGIDALGNFLLDFNLKNGETLYMIDINGNIIEMIYLPKIKNSQIYVKDMHTGGFYDISSDNWKSDN